NTSPPKPGLVRVPHQGARIEVEVWEMPLSRFGAFVAAIPAPLGIGSLQLADGAWVRRTNIFHRSLIRGSTMSNVDRRSFIKLAGIIGLSAALPFGRAYSADAPLV
ncbi:allophanate hydrolase, partial [Pseudomonas syringae pv. actinidiae ICMP 19096]